MARIFLLHPNSKIFLNFKMFDINSCLLENGPKTIYYLPEFISEEEERLLQKNVADSPKPKWTQLKNRRLQNWGGLPSSKGMIPS